MGFFRNLVNKIINTNLFEETNKQDKGISRVLSNWFGSDEVDKLTKYIKDKDKQVYFNNACKESIELTANDWYDLGIVFYNASYNMSKMAVTELWGKLRGKFESQADEILRNNPNDFYFKGMDFNDLHTIDHFLTCEVNFLDGSTMKVPFVGHYGSNYGPSYYCLHRAENEENKNALSKLSEMIRGLYLHESMKYENFEALLEDSQKYQKRAEMV